MFLIAYLSTPFGWRFKLTDNISGFFSAAVLMTIANNVGASELLRWNATQNRFTSVWSGSPYLQLEPISIQQPGGPLYLLAGADVVTNRDGKLLQISRIASQSDFVYR
jgi:hypothetical protein